MTRKPSVVFALLLMASLLTTCSDGGDPGNENIIDKWNIPSTRATIVGSAVKGPIAGAVIQVFHFAADGTLVEIISAAAPVLTDAAGAFSFPVNGSDLLGVVSPLIVSTLGGTMYGQDAPVLAAVIADPVPLSFNQVSLTCHLTVASSVAAGLLIAYADDMGAAPLWRMPTCLQTRWNASSGWTSPTTRPTPCPRPACSTPPST